MIVTLALNPSGYVSLWYLKTATLIILLVPSYIKDLKSFDQNTDTSSRTDKVDA